MCSSSPRRNRGPLAAPDNRRALLAAARRVFSERGYHAPLSAVAKEAGVGQGVLYRHFPTRLDLAFATFETHFAEFEQEAADPGPETLERLWVMLIDLTIEEVAFIEMLVDERRSHATYDGGYRMAAVLEEPLRLAVAAGRVDASLTTDDLLLGPRIAYGVVATASALEAADLRALVARALQLGSTLPPYPHGP